MRRTGEKRSHLFLRPRRKTLNPTSSLGWAHNRDPATLPSGLARNPTEEKKEKEKVGKGLVGW